MPDDLASWPTSTVTRLIDAVADHDDEIMVAYIEGDEIEPTSCAPPSARRHSTSPITPVLCGSSFKNKGVQPLLDAVVDYLPSPLDVPPVVGLVPGNGEVDPRGRRRRALRRARLQGETDPYVGKLTYFRVYSGALKAGSYVLQLHQGPQASA